MTYWLRDSGGVWHPENAAVDAAVCGHENDGTIHPDVPATGEVCSACMTIVLRTPLPQGDGDPGDPVAPS